jgi:acyl-homoserine lactone acylase PvdQ
LTVTLFLACASHAPAEEVKVYRDTWGVPHIYAETEPDAAYALGWCMAEDRLEDIHLNARTAIGGMAEYFGEDHVMTDYAMKMVENEKRCEEYWPKVSEGIRNLVEAYVKGVNDFAEKHPDRVPEYAVDLKPWHVVAIGRAMVLRWPLGTMMDDLGQKPEKSPFRSNSFAIAPKRTEEDCAILLTDPHMEWESLAIMYEARVHGGDLHMNGFFICGSPVLGLGHNNNVGWAMTTGGADTSDVYMLKLNPDMPTQYEYEGEWKYMEPKLIKIPVKGEKTARIMPAMMTMYGPLLEEPDTENHIAYAGRTPYLDDMGMIEQGYAMVKAKSADEFYQALKMNHLMEQNIMYADTQGNISYVRVGRSPIRPDSFDFTKPVPGNTKAADWLGIHDLDDHVQLHNPRHGYMQNCNVSPANMMQHSPMQEADYPAHLWNVSWDFNNPRGRRMTDLLAKNRKVTKDDAMAITMDVFDIKAPLWQRALDTSVQALGQEYMGDPDFAYSVFDIMGWDGKFLQNLTAPTLYRHWRLKVGDQIDLRKIHQQEDLTEEEQRVLLDGFKESIEDLKKLYGTREKPWGETHVVGRGDTFYPVDGADFGGGANATETVRDVVCKESPSGSGRYVAHSGTLAAMLMFMHEDGIESYTCTPWGASSVPDSPHFMDQGQELYSKRKMKPTWHKREDLLENVTSEMTLTVP